MEATICALDYFCVVFLGVFVGLIIVQLIEK